MKQWVENTGQGICEEMGEEESFQEKVKKEKFKRFFVLQPIMAEMACMGAVAITDQYGSLEAEVDQSDEELEVEVEMLTHPVPEIAFANTLLTAALDTLDTVEGVLEDNKNVEQEGNMGEIGVKRSATTLLPPVRHPVWPPLRPPDFQQVLPRGNGLVLQPCHGQEHHNLIAQCRAL